MTALGQYWHCIWVSIGTAYSSRIAKSADSFASDTAEI